MYHPKTDLGLIPAVCLLFLLLDGFFLLVGGQNLKITPEQRYLILSTKKIGTMEKELAEAAAQGFRVLTGSPTSQMEMGLFLERVPGSSQRFDYKIVATSQSKTMEKELNLAATDGFRVLPDTFITKEGMFTSEILVVLERKQGSNERYQYKLVDAIRTPTLERELSEAFANGYELIAMATWGEHVVILERSSAEGH